MNTPLRRLCAVLFSAAFLCLLCIGAHALEEALEPELLTPALYQIAEDVILIKTGTLGNEIVFDADDFEECLGVKRISEIMITSLPPVTVGTLKFGESNVLKNQVITRSRIDELRFYPTNGNESEACFTFRAVGSEEYELTCQLYLLDGINYKPSADLSATTLFEISTYENIATHRRLRITDPENDSVTFEIVKYPEKGVLTLTDRTLGTYVYTPITDFVGKDSFTYIATDQYGNRSEPAQVTIRVKENGASVVYSDLIGEAAQYHALRLTADGIATVRYENGSAVFEPSEAVTRLDFLVMAMKAAGYRVSTTADQTVFADDTDIPSSVKGYVCAAVNMGFVNGVQTDNGLYFYPNASITRAEAAVILNRMMDLDQPLIRPVFSDADSIPAYAIEAIHALSGVGILECIGNAISAGVVLNRGQCAEILGSMMDFLAA